MRESHGVLQEQIARTARERFGLLEWVQGTVAAIESGKRYLSLEEFLLLPMILSFTWYDRERPEKFIELTDLLP